MREELPLRTYMRGVAFGDGADGRAPRIEPDAQRLMPLDAIRAARVPAGVQLAFGRSDAVVEVAYAARSRPVPQAPPGQRPTFEVLANTTACAGDVVEVTGPGVVRLPIRGDDVTVHLPEALVPRMQSLCLVAGQVSRPRQRPRVVVYGDSIVQGWTATRPAAAWTARVARELEMDVVNLGYAGSGRGDLASAAQVAGPAAPDGVVVAFGTNCWRQLPETPHSLAARLAGFISTIRTARPSCPILVVTPLARPDAEDSPNGAGSTLAALRAAMEEVVAALRSDSVSCLPGRELVPTGCLVDGIHPGDEGHRAIATAVAAELRAWPCIQRIYHVGSDAEPEE